MEKQKKVVIVVFTLSFGRAPKIAGPSGSLPLPQTSRQPCQSPSSDLMSIYFQAQFVEKNNDALHYSLESLVLFSKSGFLKSLFEAPTDSPLVASSSSSSLSSSTSSSGKLGFVSVGSKFQSQLVLLMEKLRSTVSGDDDDDDDCGGDDGGDCCADEDDCCNNFQI